MIHVLVAEDELWIRSAIVEMVENMVGGFHVVGEASNGEEAWELIRQLWPAILITDIMMPKRDGLWLIQQISEHQLPIITIVLSGYDKFEYAQQAIRYGVSEYLLKPVTDVELGEALKCSFKNLQNFKEIYEYILRIQQFTEAMPEMDLHKVFEELEEFLNAVMRIKTGGRVNRSLVLQILSSKLQDMLKSVNPDFCEMSFEESNEESIRRTFRKLIEIWFKEYQQYSGTSMRLVIKRARDYIEKNYRDDLSVSELAEYSNLSISHFSVLFKQFTKESFVNYMNKTRIEKAQELLLSQDLKIYEVAEMVGYISLPYFNRVFKNYCGKTPNEFRKNMGV